MKRRILAVLLAAALVVPAFHVPSYAMEVTTEGNRISAEAGTETGLSYEDGEVVSVSSILINPLYRDLVDEEEQSAKLQAVREKSQVPGYSIQSEDTVYTTVEEAAEALKQQMLSRTGEFTIKVSRDLVKDGEDQVTQESLAAAFQIIQNKALAHTEEGSGQEGDALLWSYESVESSASFTPGDTEAIYNCTAVYYTTAEQEALLTAKVEEVKAELNLSALADEEKIKAIHDKICEITAYDTEGLNDPQNTLKYTAYAALVEGKAVCQGYAIAFYRLCKEAGIPVRIITGTSDGQNHAWNIVKLGEVYYNIDCTWDDNDGTLIYDYYLKNNEDFTDHVRAEEYNTPEFLAAYPMAAESYSSTGTQEPDPGTEPDPEPEPEPEPDPEPETVTEISTKEALLEALRVGGEYTLTKNIQVNRPAGDVPIIVEKDVTLSGGKIISEYAGILLKADLTLTDTDLQFTNAPYLGIFANGYDLSLTDVTLEWSTADPFTIAGGGVKNDTDFVAAWGDGASISMNNITIANSNGIHLYAGNVYNVTTTSGTTEPENKDTGIDYPVDFDVKKITGGTLTFYGHGATYAGNRKADANSDKIKADIKSVVRGAVSIAIEDPSSSFMEEIDGATGVANSGATVSITSPTGYLRTLEAKNRGGLTLAEGEQAPNLAVINSTEDIFYESAVIKVPADSILDLTQAGNGFKVTDFNGGGYLVMAREQVLEITGNVTGETKVAIDELNTADFTGKEPKEYHTYLVTQNMPESSFALLPTQNNDTLRFFYEEGTWTAPGEPVEEAQTPEITKQPGEALYYYGEEAQALTIEAAVSDHGELSYQWYMSTEESTEAGTAIDGATQAEYLPSLAAIGDLYYYCIVKNYNKFATVTTEATVTSDIVRITVEKATGDADISIEDWEYGVSANELTYKSVTNPGTPVITYRGTTRAGQPYEESQQVPTEAGSYIVTAVFPENEFYHEMSVSIGFTIFPATAIVDSIELEQKYYDGTRSARVKTISFVNGKGEALSLSAEDYQVTSASFDDYRVGPLRTATVNIRMKNANYVTDSSQWPYVMRGQNIEKGEVTTKVDKFVHADSSIEAAVPLKELIAHLSGYVEGEVIENAQVVSAGSIYQNARIEDGFLKFTVLDNVSVDKDTITVELQNLTSYSKATVSFVGYVTPREIWVYGLEEEMTYTGGKITQELMVFDGSTLLKEGVDYTISYKNNVKAYTYSSKDDGLFEPAKAPQAVIKMKGNYTGKQTLYFKITGYSISGNNAESDNLYTTYNGKKQAVVPTITVNGKKLTYNKDFYVQQYEERKYDSTAFVGSADQTQTYQLTVVGKGNYTGKRNITLTIGRKNAKIQEIPMNKVTVTGIKNIPWSIAAQQGGVRQAEFKVKYNGKVLEPGVDYKVIYENNEKVGTASLFIQAMDRVKDGKKFVGYKRITYKITGTAMSKVKIENLPKSGYTYTGKEIRPLELSAGENGGSSVQLYYQSSKKEPVKHLTLGKEFEAEYSNNIKRGTATIVLRGREEEGYTGTKKITFKIGADTLMDTQEKPFTVTLTDEQLKGEGTAEKPYIFPFRKGGAAPKVVVTAKDGRVLVPGEDYTLLYRNNKAVADHTKVEPSKAPAVIVKGKGNFTGTMEVKFTIEKKDVANYSDVILVAKDKPENLKSAKNGWKQSVKLYDADGKVLGNKDYDVKNLRYIVASGSKAGTDLIKNPNTVVEGGSVIRVEADLLAPNYAGTVTGTYRIIKPGYNLSKATFKLNNQAYTGDEVFIESKDQFKTATIKLNGAPKTLELGVDFVVKEGSYVNNVKRGTAKVTLVGKEGTSFAGEKTVTFKIGQRSVNVNENWKGLFVVGD